MIDPKKARTLPVGIPAHKKPKPKAKKKPVVQNPKAKNPPVKKAPVKKAAPKAPKAPSYADTDYQETIRQLDLSKAQRNARKQQEEGKVAEYYGTEAKAGTADVTKDVKQKLTKKVNKSKAELLNERHGVRKAAYRKLKASDKDHKITKKEKEAYKKQARDVAAKHKYDTQKSVDVTERKAIDKNELHKLRKPVRVAERKRLEAADKHVTKKEHEAYKLAAKKFAQKKVSGYRNVPVTRTIKRVVKKGTPAMAAGEGVYQKELADSAKKDRESISNQAAARGTLYSGAHIQKLADYNTEYNKQRDELNRQKSSQYQNIRNNYQDLDRSDQLAREKARREAVARKQARSTGAF